MKQGRDPGSKKDDKDKDPAKPADPAAGKKSLVDSTTAAPKPAPPVTSVPTTAHATKKRETEDDLQPRWRQLKTFSKRRRSDDKDEDEKTDEEKAQEEANDKAAGEMKEADATHESTRDHETPAETSEAPASDPEVTETPE